VLEPGLHVANFEILSQIGGGGFAQVYLARHRYLDTEHAIKVLLPEHVGRPEIRGRFLDEARVQALLRHPHIVRVTDVIIEPGVAGIVMDFVRGGNLADWLESAAGPPSPAEVREIFLPVLKAVGFAHSRGVVHRDLKPENVLLEEREGRGLRPKVMDFGVAKVEGELREARRSKHSTAAYARIGTLAYMSPEQVRDAAAVDHRSDLFALGTILLELVTLGCPFERDNDYDTMHAIINCDWTMPEWVPGRDPAVADVLRTALQADPADRYESCQAMAAALAGNAGPRPEARRPAPSVSTAGLSSADTHHLVEPVPTSPRPAAKPRRKTEADNTEGVLPEPLAFRAHIPRTADLPPTAEHRQEPTVFPTPIPIGDPTLLARVSRALSGVTDKERYRAAVALRKALVLRVTPASTGPALDLWSEHPNRRSSDVSLILLPGKESAARRFVFRRQADRLGLVEEWWLPEVHLRGAWNMWMELKWTGPQKSSSAQAALRDLITEQLGAEDTDAASPLPILPRRQLLDPRALDITNHRPGLLVGDARLARALRAWLEPGIREEARFVAAVTLRAAVLATVGLPGAGPALDLRAEPGDSVSLWLLPGSETGPRRFTLRYLDADRLALTSEWRSLDSRHAPRPSVRLPAAPGRAHAALELQAEWRDRVLAELEATGAPTAGGIFPA
jgi:eukaryotic-like serine/threonine-protein kinase